MRAYISAICVPSSSSSEREIEGRGTDLVILGNGELHLRVYSTFCAGVEALVTCPHDSLVDFLRITGLVLPV